MVSSLGNAVIAQTDLIHSEKSFDLLAVSSLAI